MTLRKARVHCCIQGCRRAESIPYDDAGVTGRSQVEAFLTTATAAGWVIGTDVVDGEVLAHDRCPEHRLAPVIAEVLGVPV